VSKDGVIYAGNNEDWSDPYTKFWIYPPSDGKNGWIKFGFGGGFPQGGMNEHGLFWDATGSPYLGMPMSEKTRQLFHGPLMQKILEECCTVEEAIKILGRYYCVDQYRSQYLIGDSTGVSMIVEGDNVIMKSGYFQVLTNFYLSNPELGGYPCWRYEKAVSMLSESNKFSPYTIGTILSATHQSGRYPTRYSNIYDLINKKVYLFHYHNYEEFLLIDLNKEINYLSRSFTISDLFSNVKLLPPVSQKKISGPSAILRWQGKPTSRYEILCSTESDFSDCTPVAITVVSSESCTNVLSESMIIACLIMGYVVVRKRKYFYMRLITGFIIFCSITCENDIDYVVDNGTEEFSMTIDNLLPEKLYYWKLIAFPSGYEEYKTESVMKSFSIRD